MSLIPQSTRGLNLGKAGRVLRRIFRWSQTVDYQGGTDIDATNETLERQNRIYDSVVTQVIDSQQYLSGSVENDNKRVEIKTRFHRLIDRIGFESVMKYFVSDVEQDDRAKSVFMHAMPEGFFPATAMQLQGGMPSIDFERRPGQSASDSLDNLDLQPAILFVYDGTDHRRSVVFVDLTKGVDGGNPFDGRNGIVVNKGDGVGSGTSPILVTNRDMVASASQRDTIIDAGRVTVKYVNQAITCELDSEGLYFSDIRVVREQRAAISDPSGGDTVDSQSRTAIGNILTALREHGLIATQED